MKKTFECQTSPADTLTVESLSRSRSPLGGEVWISLYESGEGGTVMVTPKRARKIAKAIKRAAKEAERGRVT